MVFSSFTLVISGLSVAFSQSCDDEPFVLYQLAKPQPRAASPALACRSGRWGAYRYWAGPKRKRWNEMRTLSSPGTTFLLCVPSLMYGLWKY